MSFARCSTLQRSLTCRPIARHVQRQSRVSYTERHAITMPVVKPSFIRDHPQASHMQWQALLKAHPGLNRECQYNCIDIPTMRFIVLPDR